MISVDIAIPILNEEKFLQACIESVLNFELSDDLIIKIYIIDGGSSDQSLDIARTFVKNFSNIQLLHNKKRIQSAAMNLIIKKGKGDYIMRLDAHTIFDKNYLKACIETSLRTNADNVGGVLETLPGDNSYGASVVQAITTNKFGVGNSEFRIGSEERASDTVPFGFFKTSIFKKIGLFDERLVRAQDYEFNRRIIKFGGKVWLNPNIKANYYNQPTLIGFLKKILFREGPYNAYMWYLAPYAFSLRHSITLLFSIGVILGLLLSPLKPFIAFPFLVIICLYFFLSIIAALDSFKKYRDYRHLVLLPFCFFVFHFLYGVGVLAGVVNILVGNASVQLRDNN